MVRGSAEILSTPPYHGLPSDWDELKAFSDGFTPSGIFKNTFDYHISKNNIAGTDYYYGHNAFQLLYGGPTNEGQITGTDAAAVINKCLTEIAGASGGLLFIDKAEYLINSKIVIPGTITQTGGERKYIEIASDRAVLKFHASLTDNAIELVAVSSPYSLKLRGLSIFCDSHDENYYAIHIENAMYVFLEDVEVGWEGLSIKNTDTVWINNLYAVDCSNEGLKLDDVGYCFADNFFIDNCGGWGGIAGFNGVLLKESTRLYFSNFNVFGEKGSYGGQEHGIYLDTVAFSHFSNFQVDGFKKSSIKCEECQRLAFTNFELIDSDQHPFSFISNTVYATEQIEISNFNIFVQGNQDALAFYAQNGKVIQQIAIANGYISGTGDGIVISDDTSTSCHDITASNVIIEVSGYGISEGGNSDYNTFSNIDARESPSGILTVGTHTKVVNSWNYTTWTNASLLLDGSNALTGKKLNMQGYPEAGGKGLDEDGAEHIIDFGINMGKNIERDTSLDGGFLRVDTRTGTKGWHFYWYTAGGGDAEKVWIDSTGKILIGTTPVTLYDGGGYLKSDYGLWLVGSLITESNVVPSSSGGGTVGSDTNHFGDAYFNAYHSSDGSTGETYTGAVATLTIKNGLVVAHT